VSPSFAPAVAEPLTNFLSSKYYEEVQSEGSFYRTPYYLNRSYNNLGSIQPYSPITSDYDFCSQCNDLYPYRVYYSQLDDTERRKDAYRQILPNNYTDIDGKNGEITDLFATFNQLYCTTPHSSYIFPTNMQTLSTEDQEAVYIGSGQVFQITPRPLKSSDAAFGGLEF
jgi:hypothetical protein